MKNYKAEYGYVKEGDFALVHIIPFYKHYTSNKVKPCYVADDGYVYTKDERIEINEGRSPICKLPEEASEEICKEDILNYYKYYIEKKLKTRVFECELTLRFHETLTGVSNTRVLKNTICPTSLSEDAADEEIRKVLIKNMRKHHKYDNPYYVFGKVKVVKGNAGGEIIYDASKFTWKEIK